MKRKAKSKQLEENEKTGDDTEAKNIYARLPRFVVEPRSRANSERYLPAVFRDFEWRGRHYVFIISPATVYREDSGERHYYPSEREETIELGLRELAVAENPNFLAGENSLYFSFSQLRRELDAMDGGFAYDDEAIKLGLDILADANYKLHSGNSELHVRAIEQLTSRSKDGETYYLARFSSFFLHKNDVFDFCFGSVEEGRGNYGK